MNNGHDENTAPAQEASCHLQHPTGLRGQNEVLRETSGINSKLVGNQPILQGCEGTCCTALEPRESREATSTAGPSKTDLPAEWDCVFVRTLPDLVPYAVRPITSSACADLNFQQGSSTLDFLCSLLVRLSDACLRTTIVMRAVECYRGCCPKSCASKAKLAGL